MKRLIGILLVFVMIVGCASAVAEMTQQESAVTMANVCLDMAKQYMKMYSESLEQPEEYLSLAYHYFGVFREFRAIYQTVNAMEKGTLSVRSLEKAFKGLSEAENMLDEYYLNWLNGDIKKNQLDVIMEAVIPNTSNIGEK